MSINLIDPNEEILKKQSWFVRGDKDNNIRIPDFQDVRSFVELKMKPKVGGYYEIDSDNVVSFKRSSSTGTIRLYGYHTRTNSDGTRNEYYSTKYTDELMGNNGKNVDYEGFGIKNIDVVYDANKVPVVTIVFYDLRGNVISNFDSKFAQMFQLPYPIFELTLQGGFGPRVTYELLKTRDDITIDESGNFIITSKFVGNRFSPLSDIPLLYLMAVPYLNNQDVNVNDTVITSFHELIINVKKLYTKLESEIQSEQERDNVSNLEQSRDTLQSLETTIQNLKNKTKETIQSWFESDNAFNILPKADKDRIQLNYIDVVSQDSNVIYFITQYKPPLLPNLNSLNNLTTSDISLINTIVSTNVNSINTALKSQPPISGNLLIPNTSIVNINNFTNSVIITINFDEVEKQRQKLELRIISDSERYASNLENRLKGLITKYLGGTRLTVGSVFDIILNDYNKLLDKVYSVGEEAKNDTSRSGNKNIRDSIPFPTVVKRDAITGAETIVFPGEIDKFKNWPEVKFVNEFIDAYFKSVRNNYLADITNEKNDNGSSKYIPFNPREKYPNTTVQPSIENSYFNKTNLNNLSELMYDRFELLGNITMKLNHFTNAQILKWNFGSSNDDTGFFSFFKDLFNNNKKNIFDEDISSNIFLSNIQFEARNIASSISSEDTIKTWFKTLKTQLDNSSENPADPNYYFTLYPRSEVTLNKTPSTNSVLGISKADSNYITISNIKPTLVTDITDEDIITKYIKNLSIKNECKFTVDNILYTPDEKLNQNTKESDYEEGLNVTVKKQYEQSSKIPRLYNNFYENTTTDRFLQGTFDFIKLSNSSKYLGLIQIPKGGLIILGALASITPYPTANTTPVTQYTAKNIENINIIKNSTFEREILQLWKDFSTKFHYKLINITNSVVNVNGSNFGGLGYEINIDSTYASSVDYNAVLEEFYTPYFVSINDYRANPQNSDLSKSLTSNGLKLDTLSDVAYLHYLKLLVLKVNENIKDIDKKVNDRFSAFESSIKDNDVKLSTYKTFQVIYENYLHKRSKTEHRLSLNDEFRFIDRAYNDISKRCVLDMKTLLSDTNDSNVSVLSAISRLLSDNNFWFYPFQGFLTTDETYNQLFDINYDTTTTTKPLFIAMYVGGLSSNPSTVRGYDITDDSIKEDDIPQDFGTGLNAFLVEFTGRQNQMVFSNFQHSTESLKNTDEGLRIQSEIITNANNSFAIPKGQSLLNVYQKQSYSSTIKIPFGNMGIQPTQYYYEKFIPIFEGLYIIYNVSHSIDSDTQRLETIFKGYRLKKDVNPIVEQELIDFIKNNAYRRLQSELQTAIQPGKDISIVAPTTNNILEIFTRGTKRTKYYELTNHHDSTFIREHKITSAGNRIWNVSYRASSNAYSDPYKSSTNYSTLIERNSNLEHVVADMVIKKGNSLFDIPAPFDGKVIGKFVDGGNNPVMCLIDNTGLKTCVILHWELARKNLNDTFKKGETLAHIGNVGQSEGPHLHLEFMTIDDYVDYLNFMLSVSSKYNGKTVFS